jgi:DAK2 domain fusion protein YloV
VDALDAARVAIDALNVFPVADGDTGTNMLLTMQAAAAAAERETAGLPAVAAAAAAGSLTAARGSSGVILSRFLSGLADGLADGDEADGATVQAALTAAADAAYDAVNDPVEGTILTVAAAAAKVARAADPGELIAVVRAAAATARAELGRTSQQLPALREAGVVDAGGQGLVVVLDALADIVAGVTAAPRPDVTIAATPASIAHPVFSYEVQYLLDAPEEALPRLRETLAGLGDAVAVVSGPGVHNVHVHVDDVGAAIEAGIEAGRPHRITVTRFADQTGRRVVALVPAGGISELFRGSGASVVEVDACPDVDAAVTAAVCAPGATSVVVLPNARDLKSVAEAAAAAARARGCTATVVPTRSPVQGLAALAVHDPARRPDDDAVTMSSAAAATRYAEVTRATYDAHTSAGPCRSGDVLGLIDDDVVTIGDDVSAVARELVDRLLIGGGELVTIVVGADAPGSLGADLADYVHLTRPAVETVVHVGGQPSFPVMLGVE